MPLSKRIQTELQPEWRCHCIDYKSLKRQAVSLVGEETDEARSRFFVALGSELDKASNLYMAQERKLCNFFITLSAKFESAARSVQSKEFKAPTPQEIMSSEAMRKYLSALLALLVHIDSLRTFSLLNILGVLKIGRNHCAADNCAHALERLRTEPFFACLRLSSLVDEVEDLCDDTLSLIFGQAHVRRGAHQQQQQQQIALAASAPPAVHTPASPKTVASMTGTELATFCTWVNLKGHVPPWVCQSMSVGDGQASLQDGDWRNIKISQLRKGVLTDLSRLLTLAGMGDMLKVLLQGMRKGGAQSSSSSSSSSSAALSSAPPPGAAASPFQYHHHHPHQQQQQQKQRPDASASPSFTFSTAQREGGSRQGFELPTFKRQLSENSRGERSWGDEHARATRHAPPYSSQSSSSSSSSWSTTGGGGGESTVGNVGDCRGGVVAPPSMKRIRAWNNMSLGDLGSLPQHDRGPRRSRPAHLGMASPFAGLHDARHHNRFADHRGSRVAPYVPSMAATSSDSTLPSRPLAFLPCAAENQQQHQEQQQQPSAMGDLPRSQSKPISTSDGGRTRSPDPGPPAGGSWGSNQSNPRSPAVGAQSLSPEAMVSQCGPEYGAMECEVSEAENLPRQDVMPGDAAWSCTNQQSAGLSGDVWMKDGGGEVPGQAVDETIARWPSHCPEQEWASSRGNISATVSSATAHSRFHICVDG